MKLRFAILPGMLLTAALAAADAPAGDLALYLSPDATKPALLKVSAGDARLANAAPMTDAAKAAEHWRSVSLPGPFTGYVPSNSTHKDLSVNPGTPIHMAPDENSPVLGATTANPLMSISSPGLDWSEVSFAGPVTAYFIATPPAAVPAVAAPPSPTPAATPSAPAAPAAPASTAMMPATATVTAIPAGKQTDAGDMAHYYYGVLKLRTNPAIGGPTNAKYVLYSNKDQVLAVVDLNDVVLPNAVATYLNKSAKIFATAYNDPKVPILVLHAVSIESN